MNEIAINDLVYYSIPNTSACVRCSVSDIVSRPNGENIYIIEDVVTRHAYFVYRQCLHRSYEAIKEQLQKSGRPKVEVVFKPWICPKCGSVYGPSVCECWRCNVANQPSQLPYPPLRQFWCSYDKTARAQTARAQMPRAQMPK